MKAVGFHRSLPIQESDALVDVEIAKPSPNPRDLLVKVEAVSVNPVDTKVRMRGNPDPDTPKILGYDAAGTVAAVGAAPTLFTPGDNVWYAGSVVRPGTDAEFHLVEEPLVGRMPKALSFAEAAPLSLTTIPA